MPTINQILRHGRQKKTRKPKAPVLLVRTNTLKKKVSIRLQQLHVHVELLLKQNLLMIKFT